MSGKRFADEIHAGSSRSTGFTPSAAPISGVDLIPRKRFVAGDVESFTDGFVIADQTRQADGEIGRRGQRPRVLAVIGDEHRLAAFQTRRERVARARDGIGNPAFAIRVRRTNNRYGNAFAFNSHSSHFNLFFA